MYISADAEALARDWLRAKRDYELALEAGFDQVGAAQLFNMRAALTSKYRLLEEELSHHTYHMSRNLMVKRALTELGADRCAMWIRARTGRALSPPPDDP